MMFKDIERFNKELISYLVRNDNNKEILRHIEVDLSDDIIFNVCNNLKELVININYPYSNNLKDESQYNLQLLEKYKNSINLVLTRFKTTKEEIFNISRI